jgi:hypothetical protein
LNFSGWGEERNLIFSKEFWNISPRFYAKRLFCPCKTYSSFRRLKMPWIYRPDINPIWYPPRSGFEHQIRVEFRPVNSRHFQPAEWQDMFFPATDFFSFLKAQHK